MTIVSLAKGQNVSLSKEAPGLKKIVVGLGWEPRNTDGKDFDLDASIFMLGENGKTRTKDAQDFCFYGNQSIANGAVVHQGDERVGAGKGDDEQILVDLMRIPEDVKHLAIVITIFEAKKRAQSFGDVRGAFARIVNAENDKEIARYDLSEDGASETAMIFAEVYRHNGEWKFKAVSQGFADGLYRLCQHFGVPADNNG